MTNARRGFLGRRGWVWTLIASWFVPVVMSGAYVALALLADTDAIGLGWFGIGYLLVLCIWFIFRMLTQTAALSRARDVGDGDLILEITNHALAQWVVVGRARLVLEQAAAYELLGDWSKVRAKVAEANVGASASKQLRVLAASLSIAADRKSVV